MIDTTLAPAKRALLVLALSGCHQPHEKPAADAAAPAPLSSSVPVTEVTEPDATGLPIIVSRTQMLVDDRRVLQLDASQHIAASDLGTPKRLIVPLAADLHAHPGHSSAILIFDRQTPYDTLLAVLYTLGQNEIGQYHLMVLHGADAGSEPPVMGKPPPAFAVALASPLKLGVHLDARGASVTTSSGSIAPRCTRLGAGVTVPKSGDRYDHAGLAACARALKSVAPTDDDVIISAAPDTLYADVIATLDDLRGDASARLFPNATFAE